MIEWFKFEMFLSCFERKFSECGRLRLPVFQYFFCTKIELARPFILAIDQKVFTLYKMKKFYANNNYRRYIFFHCPLPYIFDFFVQSMSKIRMMLFISIILQNFITLKWQEVKLQLFCTVFSVLKNAIFIILIIQKMFQLERCCSNLQLYIKNNRKIMMTSKEF